MECRPHHRLLLVDESRLHHPLQPKVLEGVGLMEKSLKNTVSWKRLDMLRPKELSDQTSVLKKGQLKIQVCIAGFKKGQLKILSHAYDRSLGGRDYDEVLFKHFVAKFKEEYKIDVYQNARASFSIVGNAIIEKSDLQPALKALKDRLMTKNVAEEIAEKLCESVAASLEGKKLGSFTRISSTVQVAYWLLQHNISVMLAACDTFRSGAVEQLRTHARRLQIPIFEKGYEKDPAIVAREAIQEASRNKSDVVLVDTAGRMQDNEPLMRALSKLINLNNPDLVLFVGEALVGNDAVDQLSKFNQKLADLSTIPNARLIDGILLTKFDTIDDKVGAALSMVYISGAPVMFVGCGQSYTDLKKLNVKSIVKTLLK